MTVLFQCGRQADALNVYGEGRRVLAEELGLDPGPELRKEHERILRGVPYGQVSVESAPPVEQEISSHDASADESSGRRFLPYGTTDFAGRTSEISHLLVECRRQASTTVVISAIDGMGGIGKTALALHLAHRLADDYPDGQYFVDLHGYTSGIAPLSASQALEALLRDSGLSGDLIPDQVDRRSALWRSRVAGRRVLILLDNAKDAAQVRPLLPGVAGALVIVTSRRRLSSIEGAVPLSLEVLSHEDALTLFIRIVGVERTAAEAEAADEVIELCGRLPLAVRVAAARLRDRASWTIGHLAALLVTISADLES